jgi:hypothetical protein
MRVARDAPTFKLWAPANPPAVGRVLMEIAEDLGTEGDVNWRRLTVARD